MFIHMYKVSNVYSSGNFETLYMQINIKTMGKKKKSKCISMMIYFHSLVLWFTVSDGTNSKPTHQPKTKADSVSEKLCSVQDTPYNGQSPELI
jgi:hypothetical protein